MPKTYSRIGFVVVLLLMIGLVWWSGLGTDPRPPTEHAIGGLGDSIVLRGSDTQTPIIETDDPTAALTGLGYVHGLQRGWTLLLWRQTALGHLGRWFGPGVAPLDRHARRLGLARHARTAYEQLSAPNRARLQAYTDGLNAALQTTVARQSEPLVLLDRTPTEWAPWHTLLIERLLAWTATDPLSPPTSAPPAVTQFADTDRRFRRWLHLHGWSRSTAWAVHPDSIQPTLFQRHVLGASATPIIQEVRWTRPNGSTTTWGTLPGALLFPTGTTDQRAWASLLHSTATLTQVPVDSADIHYWYERIAPKDSDEQLLRVERLGEALVLATQSPPPSVSLNVFQSGSLFPDTSRVVPADTAWTVRWPGFSTTSDVGAWLRRGDLRSSSSETDPFTLFAADGLRIPTTGKPTVLGRPSIVATPHEDLAVIGHSPWTRFQATGVANAMAQADSVAVGRWSARDLSPWATALLSSLRPALRPFAQQDGAVGNAATYLQNWDYDYDPMSIGAVLFDQWMQTYRTKLGHVPLPSDTTRNRARPLQQRAFQQALDTLITQLGSDIRQWRWERVVTDRRYFPVWSADSMVSADLGDLQSTRYAPLTRTATGHPSAPAGGPSLVDPSPVAPSPDTWEGWMSPGRPMTVRRHRFNPEANFARWRLQAKRPLPHRLSGSSSSHTTLLHSKQ